MQEVGIMLVEDDAGFAELVEAWLADALAEDRALFPSHGIAITPATTLAEARALLPGAGCDLILADLNLPDARGIDTFTGLVELAPLLPIIVLSNLDDADLAIQAVRLGAQDYLVKSQLTGHLLLRAIRYTLERHRLHRELEATRERERVQRERFFLERLVSQGSSPTAARALGIQPLRVGLPELFGQLVERFAGLLGKQLEMRTYKVIHPLLPELKALAEELVFLRAGPRDVVEIYKATLERTGDTLNPLKTEALHEEGRYLAFELMGHLVTFYRPYALGGRRPSATNDQEP